MPLPILTVEEMRRWEAATWKSGQTEKEVIARVGKEVAKRALEMTREGDFILLLAGKGHNGDDVRAARAHLSGRRVSQQEVNDPAEALGEFRRELARTRRRWDLIVDGLFGIGLDRPLADPWVEFIRAVNDGGKQILAVDVPSGLDLSTGKAPAEAIRATVTLTVGAPKNGLLCEENWPYVGRLEVAREVGLLPIEQSEVAVKIGLNEANAAWVIPDDFGSFPPQRSVSSHKGSHGHLVIIAGSRGYHGAAVLAARGAQRARPGLVTVWTAEEAYQPVAAQLAAAMVRPWKAGSPLPETCSAVLVGPGLASSSLPDDLKSEVRHLWEELPLPMVADASALDWLKGRRPAAGRLRVITPHPGEAARMLGRSAQAIQSNRFQTVRDLSRSQGNCWVILKGHQTLIGRTEGTILVNSSGNPFLAQGGTGDLLAGYLGGWLAQPHLETPVERILSYAAWQHGAAADLLSENRDNWTTEDLELQLGRINCFL